MSPKLKPETLEARRAHILSAARTCFARQGYHQTTMDDIVQEAGLSKGGVYWHFESKKALFLAIIQSELDDAQAMMQGAVNAQPTPRQKLEAVVAFFGALTASEQLMEMAPLTLDVWAQNWQDPEINDVALAVYARFRGSIVQVVEAGIAQGAFKAVDATALANILLALYDGLLVQAVIERSTLDWAAISETLSRTLVAGLLSDESGGEARS
jgi:AcrR family transcriptional regulator